MNNDSKPNQSKIKYSQIFIVIIFIYHLVGFK